MTDVLEVYFVYPDSVSESDKLEMLEELYSSDEFETTQSIDEFRDRLRPEGALQSTNFIYGDIHPRVNPNRSIDGLPDLPIVIFHLEQKEFRERVYSEDKIAEHVDDLLTLAKEFYQISIEHGNQPLYVIGANPTETENLRTDDDRNQTTAEGIREGAIEELYWLQIWPSRFVQSLGKDTIEGAPAWHIEELEEGSVMLVSYQNPLFVGDDYFDLLDHLSLS